MPDSILFHKSIKNIFLHNAVAFIFLFLGFISMFLGEARFSLSFSSIFCFASSIICFAVGERTLLKMTRKPELIFLILSLVFGTLFVFITPPNDVPDERTHLLRAYQVANGQFYNNPDEFGSDIPPFFDIIFDKTLRGLSIDELNTKCNMSSSEWNALPANNFNSAFSYSPLMYLSSGTGLYLAKDKNFLFAFYTGRFFNIFASILMIYWAIRITPKFKYLFLFAAMLPMTLSLMASFSCDAFVISLAFLFFAKVFEILYRNAPLRKIDYIFIAILMLCSAWSKMVIFPIFFLLLVPGKYFPVKNKIIFCGLIILCAILVSSVWNSMNVWPMEFRNQSADYELQSSFVFRHPWRFIKALATTISMEYRAIFKSLIGILGWLDLLMPAYYYKIMTVIMIAKFVFLPEKDIRVSHRITGAVIFALFVVAIYFFLYKTWTPPRHNIILGVQGRYFIPMVCALFPVFILTGKARSCLARFINSYKIFLMFFICFSLLIASRQMLIFFWG